jgi:adenylate cyclase
MRIAPRAALCANDWRVHADDSNVRFEELRELCALAGDKTSLAIGFQGPLAVHAQRGETQAALRLASELIALLDSIGDPALTAQAAFGAVSIKFQAGEMGEILRWAQATIEWADGDPTKGNFVVGSPLAWALALRGVALSWFGRPGWREDLDDAVAFAEQSAEPLTIAVVMSYKCGTGTWNGVLRADDAAVHMTESALKTAQASGDDYAVVMLRYLLGSVLLIRGTPADRYRGLELLTQVRETAVQQRFHGSELPIIDVYIAREQARGGDRDGGIPLIRKSVDALTTRGQVGYYIPATGVLVETLLSRGAEGDMAEAEAVIARLAAAPADGSVIRDVWLLRMRALLARARGHETSYRDYRDRYRALATSLGFEGHMAWAEAMP